MKLIERSQVVLFNAISGLICIERIMLMPLELPALFVDCQVLGNDVLER